MNGLLARFTLHRWAESSLRDKPKDSQSTAKPQIIAFAFPAVNT